jgi:hypothetical protein
MTGTERRTGATPGSAASAAAGPPTAAGTPASTGPRTSAAFDRIGQPGSRSPVRRDGLGKEALYTTAPSAAPSTQVELRCRRCQVPFGRSLLGVLQLCRPPCLLDPIRRRLWTRCPACGHRAWLEVGAGPVLRMLRSLGRVGD